MTIYRGGTTPSAGVAPSGSASKVDIDDDGGLFTATTVEAALAEIAAKDAEIEVSVWNATGATLAIGTPVYISGHNAANNIPTVAKADATDGTKMPTIGLVKSAISNLSAGKVVGYGLIKGLDTTAITGVTAIGDALYTSALTAGELTATKPAVATDQIQKVGEVSKYDATDGHIMVIGAGRTNDVPNLTTNKYWEGDGSNHAAEITADDILANMTLATGKMWEGDGSNDPAAKDPEQVVYQNFVCTVLEYDENVVAADGQYQFMIPDSLNGCSLVNINAATATNTFSSGTYAIDVRKNATDMLSTALTIDTGETDTSDPATPAVIKSDGSETVATDDVIKIDVTTIGGGGNAAGLWVTLEFLKS